jgi:hypothetical protein
MNDEDDDQQAIMKRHVGPCRDDKHPASVPCNGISGNSDRQSRSHLRQSALSQSRRRSRDEQTGSVQVSPGQCPQSVISAPASTSTSQYMTNPTYSTLLDPFDSASSMKRYVSRQFRRT